MAESTWGRQKETCGWEKAEITASETAVAATNTTTNTSTHNITHSPSLSLTLLLKCYHITATTTTITSAPLIQFLHSLP